MTCQKNNDWKRRIPGTTEGHCNSNAAVKNDRWQNDEGQEKDTLSQLLLASEKKKKKKEKEGTLDKRH